MKKFLVVGLASLLLVGCSSEMPDDVVEIDESVEIGVLLPLSGDAAAYGEEAKAVLEAQISDRTDVRLVFEDSKCEPSASVAAIQKLGSIDGIEYVIGGLCSNETLAIANQLESIGVLAISPSSSNPEIEGASSNQFSLSYKDSDVGDVLVSKLQGFESVAIISEQNDFSIGLRNAVEAGISEDAIVVNETFESNNKDFRNIIEKVKNANPDAIFLNPFVGENASLLLTQIEELGGLGDAALFGQAAFVPSELLAEKGSVIEGMTIVDAPSVFGEEAEKFEADLAEAGVTYDNLGAYYAAAYADALNILLEVSEKENLETALNAMRSMTFDGLVSDELSFGENSFAQGIGVGEFEVREGVLERL